MIRIYPFSAVVLALVSVLTLFSSAQAEPLGPVEPSAEEQEGIYIINFARRNPRLYGETVNLPEIFDVTPQPALAVNTRLTGSARFHTQEMVDDNNEYFAHTSQVTGDGPNKMAVQNGYNLFGDGLNTDWGAANFIESIARGINQTRDYPEAISALIIDEGVSPPGHRIHLLALNQGFTTHNEIGCGFTQDRVATDPGGCPNCVGLPEFVYAIHTGYENEADTFLTGVVYDDDNGDFFYQAGEGLGGVTISVVGMDVVFDQDIPSMAEGGYALKVPTGTYNVIASGGAFQGQAITEVTVGTDNVEIDFISGSRAAIVDFSVVEPPPPLGVTIIASVTAGNSPLAVDFSAQASEEGLTYLWDFGDGSGTSDDATESHVFTAPGIHEVTLTVSNDLQSVSDTQVIIVGDGNPSGGVILPANSGLGVLGFAAKANFAKPGKDSVKVKGTLEMPGGFAPSGNDQVQVSAAGVTLNFTIDEKGKGQDANKNKVKIKFKRNKDGSPLAAGVIAKFSVKIKGDHAAALQAAGLSNATEIKNIEGVPVAILINNIAYSAFVNAAVKSKEGKKSAAKLLK